MFCVQSVEVIHSLSRCISTLHYWPLLGHKYRARFPWSQIRLIDLTILSGQYNLFALKLCRFCITKHVFAIRLIELCKLDRDVIL